MRQPWPEILDFLYIMMGSHYPTGRRQLNNEAFHTGSALGLAEKFLSWAWPESPVWTKFGSDLECRLGISDPSCRMFSLVPQLGVGPSRAPSRASMKCPMWSNNFKNNIWNCCILKSRHEFIVASDHWPKERVFCTIENASTRSL